MWKYLLICIYLFTRSGLLLSQTPPCGFETATNDWIKKAGNSSIVAKTEELIKSYIAENQLQSRENITISVVVHVVYKGDPGNLSDASIRSQIDQLNRDYNGENEDGANVPVEFQKDKAAVGIRFCLADTDPQGQPTNGITRTKTNIENIGSKYDPNGYKMVHYTILGGEDAWDAERYLNIWVADMETFLGYGSAPLRASPAEDGVIISPKAFGIIGDVIGGHQRMGRTLTHETGHYFNLLHTWGNSINNCEAGDSVGDTPPQSHPYYGCPQWPQSSCGQHDMYMNFMDYTDDVCMCMFTKGQKDRMMAALYLFRAKLIHGESCTDPSGQTGTLKDAVKIYKNFTSGAFAFEINTPDNSRVRFSVYDCTGRLIYQRQLGSYVFYQENVDKLASGIYFLSFNDGKETFTTRLAVVR